MTPEDPRHGTTRGYAQGCKNTCCREAQNTYERNRRKRRQVLGEVRRIDSTGTRRRIHALMAIGWPGLEIARRCGWTHQNAVLEITQRTWVYTTTAATIANLYDELCMTPGPSVKNRRDADRKGWVVPLRWDDIDADPTPHDCTYTPPARTDLTARAELVDDMHAQGYTITEVCQHLGLNQEAVEKWADRHGYRPVYNALVRRERGAA